ncbi:unnamed protein product [Caenorhabditis nigoni]
MSKIGSKIAKFAGELDDLNKMVLKDGMRWFKNKTGEKRVKPRKSTIILDGEVLVSVNCVNVDTDTLKKYVIFSEKDSSVYAIYVNSIAVDVSHYLNLKKPKISEETAKLVREHLASRTVASTETILRLNNINVSTKQITNQCRYVSSVSKLKRGIRPVTVPNELAEFARTNENSFFFSSNSEYRLIYLDCDLLSIYINNLPSSRKLNSYRSELEDIEQWTSSTFHEYLASNEEFFTSGIDNRFTGQIQIDVTFDLCSAYVTVLSADLPHFITKSSQKIRYSMLGFMIHNSKHAAHHEAFAEKIAETFENFDKTKKKRVPSIVHDGELALNAYSNGWHMQDAMVLRCEMHRKSNIMQRFGPSVCTESTLRRIFGKIEDGRYLKRGILNTFSIEEFVKKVEKANIHDDVKMWLVDNQDELFLHHSLRSKLMAGVSVQYSTTNKIESMNAKLKTFITRPESGRYCAEKIVELIEDEKRHIIQSVVSGDDRLVSFEKFANMEQLTVIEKSNQLAKLGIQNQFSVIFKVPEQLKQHFATISIKEVENLKLFENSDEMLISKSSQSNVFIKVDIEDGLLRCTNSSCAAKIPTACNHLAAVIANATSEDRIVYFAAWQKQCEKMTIRMSERSKETKGQARRYKRKFNKFSKTNFSRTLNGVVITDSEESSDESDLKRKRKRHLSPTTSIVSSNSDISSNFLRNSMSVSPSKIDDSSEDISTTLNTTDNRAKYIPMKYRGLDLDGSDDDEEILAKTSATAPSSSSQPEQPQRLRTLPRRSCRIIKKD